MFDKTTVKFSSKSSMKMVAQVVDLTYHGPIATTSRGGALGALMKQVSSSVNFDSSSENSSASVDLLDLMGLELPTLVDPVRFKDARDIFMVVYDSDNIRVKSFHDTLNQLKIQALGGKTRKTLTQSEIERIRTHMLNVNVGKIIKITLQIRLVSEEPFTGSHTARDGHSLTKTLYTFYCRYDSSRSIAAQLEQISREFVGWYNQPVGSSTSTQSAELVVSDNLDSIKIIPKTDVIKTVEFDNGDKVSLNPEDVKPKSIRLQMSTAFSKKV